MSKIGSSLKRISTSTSLFDLIENYFPFKNYKEKFDNRLKNSIKKLFINDEIDRIIKTYHTMYSQRDHSYSSPAQDGYFLKRRGYSLPLTVIWHWFLWKEDIVQGSGAWTNLEDDIRQYEKGFLSGLPDIKADQFIKDFHFKELAIGVNDAQLEEYIVDLKAGAIKTNQEKPTIKSIAFAYACMIETNEYSDPISKNNCNGILDTYDFNKPDNREDFITFLNHYKNKQNRESALAPKSKRSYTEHISRIKLAITIVPLNGEAYKMCHQTLKTIQEKKADLIPS